MLISNPAFDYDNHGHIYSGYRQTDPRIAAIVHNALSSAQTVLNVGAGAGSYEPGDKYVVAVEPSGTMRAQRAANNKVPAVIGKADALPFDDDAFDAVMAMVTLHHWTDIPKGLQELRRVAKDQVVLLTFDPEALPDFWLADYFPELVAAEQNRFPTIDALTGMLGGTSEVIHIPVPFDCVDGFTEAFYGRPEAFLDENIRASQSAWAFVADEAEARGVRKLADDLASGAWDEKYGHHRTLPDFTCALRLIVARP